MDRVTINEGIFPYSKQEAEESGVDLYFADSNRNTRFPQIMKDLRAKLGLTQQEVADAVGVTKSTIGQYENGEYIPDAKKLYKLAKLFNVSSDYIIGLTEVKTTDTTTQAVCTATGLSEAAVSRLIKMKENVLLGNYDEQYKTLSSLLEDQNFMEALQMLHGLRFNTLERKHRLEPLPDSEETVEYHAVDINDPFTYNGIRWEIANLFEEAVNEIVHR